MPRTTKHYFIPSTGESVSAVRLKQFGQDLQTEAMRHWFNDEYDAPDELPYDSGEGGYQWIWGGPYDAEEELQNEFSGTVADNLIVDLASELNNISSEWSGKPSYDDFDVDYRAHLLQSETDPFSTMISSLVDIENVATIKVGNGTNEQRTLHKLLFANVITALETFLADLFMKTLSASDQYTEEFVRKTPHFRETQIRLCHIFERFKKIGDDVQAYVRNHNWHMLAESGMMYKRAFDIKFPEVPTTIADGIRDRHNIVHRNGKTQEGAEGSWELHQILALKNAVIQFAGEINEQVMKMGGANGPPHDPEF